MMMRTRISRLARAVLLASATYAVLFVAAVILIDVWHGRQLRVGVLLSFVSWPAAIVAVTGALLQWPVLRLIGSRNRGVMAGAGAILAIIPIAAFVLLFRDDDDPATLAGYVRFWIGVPGEFLLGVLPMAVAGAILGWFAVPEQRSAV